MDAKQIALLLVEDDAAEVRQIEERLAAADLPVERLVVAGGLGPALERLAEESFDLVLLDLSLPDAAGSEAVARLARAAAGVPIVVLLGASAEESGGGDEEIGLEAVRAGAEDYIGKRELDGRRLRRALRDGMERSRRRSRGSGSGGAGDGAGPEWERVIRNREQVMGMVAHDLRNPLNTITLYASLLQDTALASEQRASYVRGLVRSAEQVDALIQDLLDVTSAEAGKLHVAPEPVEARRLLTDAYAAHETLAGERGFALSCESSEGLPRVLADRARVARVFANLIGNAMKFTPRSGTIRLQAASTSGGVRFSVIDTGPGIREEDLPHVFDRFWQAPGSGHSGAGLGLAIVKGIVEAHGGVAWVDSRRGRGSAFHFTLPVAPGERQVSGPAHAA